MSNLPLRCENKALIGVKCMKVNDEERACLFLLVAAGVPVGPVVLAEVLARK